MIETVVLAAGASRRMGTPKQLLPFGDSTVLQHVVDAAGSAALDGVVLVLGPRAEEILGSLRRPKGIRVVRNEDFGSGMASSLRAGLASMRPTTRAAVILLGDQPTVTAASIRAVAEEFRRSGSVVVRARYGGREGHPVLLARVTWSAVSAVEGDAGARGALRRFEVTPVDVEGTVPPDVDTWEEYLAARGSLPRRPSG
jgi:molybdenum cofactor cytidylyltransferase